MLLSSDGYLSGEDISEALGVSRTAVWKHINKLREEGYKITSSTNRGYLIEKNAEVYSAFEIKRNLHTELIGREIYFYDETLSTNAAAKDCREAADGAVFVAVNQTGGRGRLGRSWVSGEDGVWFSLLLKPDILPAEVSLITLVAGLAVSAVIDGAGIKWPNDIILSGKKVCGILTEMSSEVTSLNYVVCGIGINLNIKEFPAELSDKATSVYIETGKLTPKAQFLASVLESFERYYLIFLEKGFDGCIDEYRKKCITLGKDVSIVRNGESFQAKAVDVSPAGELIIERENGDLEAVFSGEVSVRGLLGYS